MSMFNGAHHFSIDRIDVSSHDPGAFRDLCENIAVGAFLNSSERSDAPKYHPETRVAVQREMYAWVMDDNRSAQPRSLLWLTVPAGSGKTTITNTAGERFKMGGNLTAAFFFSSLSSSQERKTKGRFVTTLAYQLVK